MFKVYLPSNACPHVYPSNTPTDFRTQLNQPITLEGQWEVGVESICYAAHIHDEKQRATLTCKVAKVIKPPVNDVSKYRYRTTPSWPGFEGILPPHFEPDSRKVEDVLDCLNGLNDVMLTSRRAFRFYISVRNNVVFYPYDRQLYLKLSPRLAQALGFGFVDTLGGKPYEAFFKRKTMTLTHKDYHVTYLNTTVQKLAHNITIKWGGKAFDGRLESFIAMWNKAVSPYVRASVEFKKGKLIIHNHEETMALVFSPSFQRTFHHEWPIIGAASVWSAKRLNLSASQQEYWYVDVYSAELVRTRRLSYTNIPITLYPWRQKTVQTLLRLINRKVTRTLQRKLKSAYNKARHEFRLSLQPTEHMTLRLGRRLEVEFSQNLAYLLGFPNQRYDRRETDAVREVDHLFNRSRRLHLLTNIIQPTAIGNKQVQIIRDFLHKNSNESMAEKHFDPISYIPVRINTIDMIHFQLVDDTYEPVDIKDSKTLVTLYFRKI